MSNNINTNELLDSICELLKEGHSAVAMPVSGGSMCPFLHSGDTAFLDVSEDYKKGDIILYKRADNRYILHRIVKINGDVLFCSGDAQKALERVDKNSVCAKVCHVSHKGKMIVKDSFRWKFYAHIWLFIRPIRPTLLKLSRKYKEI